MNRKTGFTLIELLAVVLIIAILTAVALPQYRRAIQRTQATEALMNLRTMFDSAMRYRAANSENPNFVSQLDVQFFEAQDSTGECKPTGNFTAKTYCNTDIGFFRYYLALDISRSSNGGPNANPGIMACYRTPSDDGAPRNAFCLYMNYKTFRLNGKDYGPGTIFCDNKEGHKKYDFVCNYLGTKIEGTDIYIIE